ncbi:hypothetical protein H9P43_001843 [Blastocladiella emersonii ATCC 22665]|nr:hypothetical protein H9P43_001843 [Blastocladiella emersonii ATCC 22665]
MKNSRSTMSSHMHHTSSVAASTREPLRDDDRGPMSTSAGGDPGGGGRLKKSTSGNVLTKAGSLFKLGGGYSSTAALGPAPSHRPPLTSDIDELLGIEAAVQEAQPAVSETPRPRGVSTLVHRLSIRPQLSRAASNHHHSPAGAAAAAGGMAGSSHALSGRSTYALYVKPEDAYTPEPTMPYLRHGRQNVDIDTILAEVEETKADAAVRNSNTLSAKNGGRHDHVRRWSAPGMTLTRDPPNKVNGADNPKTALSPIGSDSGIPVASVTVRYRSMNDLGSPAGTRGHGTASPLLEPSASAVVRDLPLPTPVDIDELLTSFGVSRSARKSGNSKSSKRSAATVPSSSGSPSSSAKPKPGGGRSAHSASMNNVGRANPRAHGASASTTAVYTPSPLNNASANGHAASSHGMPSAAVTPVHGTLASTHKNGPESSSVRAVRSPSVMTGGTQQLRSSNEAIYLRHFDHSGVSSPSNVSPRSSADRLSHHTGGGGGTLHAQSPPTLLPTSHSMGDHGGGSMTCEPIAEDPTGAGTGSASLGALDAADRASVATSSEAGGDSSSILDEEAENARMIKALRSLPRPVLDRVYVHHSNDIDALFAQSTTSMATPP